MTRINPAAVELVAGALHDDYDQAPDIERERAREDARELLQLARREGRRRRRREAELRAELAAIVIGACEGCEALPMARRAA